MNAAGRFCFVALMVTVTLIVTGCIAPLDPTTTLDGGAQPGAAQMAAEPEGISVDAAESIGSVSPLLFGTNYGPWVSLRPETLPLAYEAGISVVRWLGGEWGDQNDLRAPQIDQFVDLTRKMGAEPYIHVRFIDGSPEQAAELVRYANLEKGYDVRYWAIGNEPSLYEGRGHPWDAQAFSAEWRIFAEAMKAVDPSILLLGPETHQFNGTPQVDPRDSNGRDWLRTFLAANGDLVDIVAVHRYPFPNDAERTPASIEDLRADAPGWTLLARNLRQVVEDETGRDLPLGITEFNSHWSRATRGEATPDSFFAAIWLGDVLGRLAVEQIDMVNQFLLVSGPESGFGLLEKYGPRPAYFTYQMYGDFGSELVAAASSLSGLTVYAALREDGALTVMVINLGDGAQSVPLRVNGYSGSGVAEAIRFDAELEAGFIEAPAFAEQMELSLPGRSMTLYIFR